MRVRVLIQLRIQNWYINDYRLANFMLIVLIQRKVTKKQNFIRKKMFNKKKLFIN